MNTRIGLAAAAIALCIAGTASAGEVKNRLNNQQARINGGIASGQITRREDNNLARRDASINAQRRADLRANGGHLTPGERAQLNRRENNVSRSIYYDKHDLARQPGAPLPQ